MGLTKISDKTFGKSPKDGKPMNSFTFRSGGREVTCLSSWSPGQSGRARNDDGERSKPPLF